MRFFKIVFSVIIWFLMTINLYSQTSQLNSLINLISNQKDFDGSNYQIFNVQYSYTDRDIISFNRQIGDSRELWIYNNNNKFLKKISSINNEIDIEVLYDSESTFKKYYDGNISWCPVKINSKQWFVFVSSGEHKNIDLYLGHIDEKTMRPYNQFIRLTNDRAVDNQPVWSPDGNRIAFISNRGADFGNVYILDNLITLLNEYKYKMHNEAVEGSLIFDFYEHIEREVFSDSEKNEIRLIQVTDNDNVELYPYFSPDGKYLAITSKDYDDEILNYGISIIKLDGYKSPKRFTTSTSTESKAVWSPDGKYIFYYSSSGIEDDKKDIVVSRFDEYGETANKSKTVVSNVQTEDYEKPNLSFNSEAGYSVVYKYYDRSTDNISLRVTPIDNYKKTQILFQQKAPIINASTFGNSFVLVRQVGDDYSIDYQISNYLQDFDTRISVWEGGISKSKSLYYYIGGGAAVVGGIVLWLIDDDSGKKDEFKLGSPPRPGKNNN